jgi:hypothetical protein
MLEIKAAGAARLRPGVIHRSTETMKDSSFVP